MLTGRRVALPQDAGNKYDVFEAQQIELAKGDKIRITRNGFDSEDKRLNNGQTLEVVSVRKNGQIQLRNRISKADYIIDKNFGHFAHAHCVTSQFSQGKTVDEVFIAQPAATFAATDAKQFYVSVSRARERARVYTDDKQTLLTYASELGDRRSALELWASKDKHMEQVQQLQRNHVNLSNPTIPIKEDKSLDVQRPSIKYDDYEPTL